MESETLSNNDQMEIETTEKVSEVSVPNNQTPNASKTDKKGNRTYTTIQGRPASKQTEPKVEYAYRESTKSVYCKWS
jgi:hypothetical protein